MSVYGPIHNLVYWLVPPVEVPAWTLWPVFGAVALAWFEWRVEARHR